MADPVVQRVVAEYTNFVNELDTVERKTILALTDVARDTWVRQPQATSSLAAVIVNRVLQVGAGHWARGASASEGHASQQQLAQPAALTTRRPLPT